MQPLLQALHLESIKKKSLSFLNKCCLKLQPTLQKETLNI